MPADRGRHRHGAVKQRGGPTDDVSAQKPNCQWCHRDRRRGQV